MKGECEVCAQQGELEMFPVPVMVDSISEAMMCEACRNGDAMERWLELVLVPKGVIKIVGKARDGNRGKDDRCGPVEE